MQASDELPAPGALIGGRYRIESMLGRGGMGAVFAAMNVATGRAVAIKWMLPRARSPESIARFLAEARATARIEHPNVISLLDAGEENGSPFLVMERLRGESLGERLKRGRLSPMEALDVAIAACRGVAAAHAEGIVHRDLKPDNIFLCVGKDGTPHPPKVLDFGISKLFDGQGAPSLTQTGMAIGTPSYMSPEQLNAPRDVDARVDVYAMGVVLYQALAGRVPYDAESLWMLVHQISVGQPPPLRAFAPEVPPALEATVMRAMHARRELRHTTMFELLTELEGSRGALARASSYVHAPQAPAPYAAPSTPVANIAAGSWSSAPAASYGAPAGHPPSMPMAMAPSVARPVAAPPSAASRMVPMLVAALGVALLGLVAVVVVGAVLLWPSREPPSSPVLGSSQPSGSSAPARSGDGLRPRVELRFSGACRPSYEGTMSVQRTDAGAIAVGSMADEARIGAFVLSPGSARIEGSIALTEEHFNSTGFFVMVMAASEEQWGSYRSPHHLYGPWPTTGTVSFARWEPERGIMDITLDDVTLHSTQTGSACRVSGRVQTFGLTWGS
jgi:serine/threonine-protein kinase